MTDLGSQLLIDKNSLWGGSNIQNRELCVKRILAQDLGFAWGPFQRGFRGFSGYRKEDYPLGKEAKVW